ncbi:HAD hydrolase family protein [Mycoplasma sp. ATU-Cv-508]|uniref:HAD hydrolase family protein n=1 Tax=Mycoplasma sp. ATU-Cv-508 TaxID=2048001 RepID=UPI000FDF495B
MKNLVANIKVFFLDLDGTLVDEKNDQISQANALAISKLPAGVQAIISTGRQGPKATKFIDQLNVKFAVCANGALIVNRSGAIVFARTMNSRQISTVLGFIRRNKLSFKCDDQMIAYGVRVLLVAFSCANLVTAWPAVTRLVPKITTK